MYEYLLELIKRIWKFQEKNMPCERALDFDQWLIMACSQTFTENNRRLWLFSSSLKVKSGILPPMTK